ncbi:globin [Aliiroseovarius sp. S1339]|uniref:globin n=1 Tax=Aliiroseovarius sp. S1339 TaxID=2936990 RepID=UPI0020C1052C|nr:globin [Aliiroseovarius sp. S1339]MCK8462691.1 globin [Aliiroseovarius sp. S1339]
MTRSRCKRSLHLLVGREQEVASAFFSLLFARVPEMRVIFPGDIENPAVQLQWFYRMVIAFAGNDAMLVNKLRLIGFRMAMRGMDRRHCEVLANTLIGTLQRHLCGSWQSDYSHAWRNAKAEALDIMEDGAGLMAA